jgi:uncharacterized protein YbdZ (MbtH family)
MSWNDPDREDTTIYRVVVNHEEQYSIWPADRENALGWNDVGKTGSKAECLAYIKEVWTDLRPLSLRKKMEEIANNPPPRRVTVDSKSEEKSLVEKLCEGEHPVEAGLRPEGTVKQFKEAIDRGYVHIRFTDTQGGTELGVRLDTEACDFSNADFDGGAGSVHLEGGLSLDFVKVRCTADIDMKSLAGTGRISKLEAIPQSEDAELGASNSSRRAGIKARGKRIRKKTPKDVANKLA